MSLSHSVLFFLRRVGPYHHARFQAAAKKLNLIVVETRPASVEYPWEFEAKGDYFRHPFPIARNSEHGLRGCLLKKEITQLFDTHRPDVVVTTGWADPEYHAVLLEASRRSIGCVVVSDSRFEDERRKFYKEWIKKQIIQFYSSALVAGSASESYLIKLGFQRSAIFKPWDVVDNLHFLKSKDRVKPVSFQERYFLCVSRFIAKKNIDGLLFGYANYKKTGGKRNLLIVGSGYLKNEITRLIDLLQLNAHVTLVGFIQYDALPSYFCSAFCLILPSHTDQWGLVCNEAMACGLPVLVSTKCGCAEDLVEEGKNGFTFDPNAAKNIEDVLVKIDRLSIAQWVEMSEHTVQTISHWTTDHFAVGLFDACLNAIRQKRVVRSFFPLLIRSLLTH